MVNTIINKKFNQYQLVRIGIDLVSAVHGLLDCNSDIRINPHADKVRVLATQWNEEFIKLVISKEGVQS